jgi:dTDP-4-amino-4,6-dideoxygalactose transaminase
MNWGHNTSSHRGKQQALTAAGISSGLHYPIPVHLQPAYAHLGYGVGDFPIAERVAGECLSLPMYAALTEAQQDYIAHS